VQVPGAGSTYLEDSHDGQKSVGGEVCFVLAVGRQRGRQWEGCTAADVLGKWRIKRDAADRGPRGDAGQGGAVMNEDIIVRLCARQVRLLDKVLGRYGRRLLPKNKCGQVLECDRINPT
jgi:hypothetical protein